MVLKLQAVPCSKWDVAVPWDHMFQVCLFIESGTCFPYTPVLEQLSSLCKCQCHGLVLLNFPVDLVRNLFPPFVATHNDLIDFQAMTGATRQKVQLDLLGAQLRLQCQCCHSDGSLSNSMHDTSLAYVHSLEYQSSGYLHPSDWQWLECHIKVCPWS